MTDLAGKNVLITGGGSGLGRRMAHRMAKQGATLVLWDINDGNLQKVTGELKEITGRPAHGYRCDVSNRHDVYATANRVRAEVGPVHVLVNNAGIVSGKRFLDLPDEKIEATFGVNTLSLFWTAKAFLPAMIERNEGHIVTIASASGLIGVARLADYSASKFAAFGFDESLRMELRRMKSRVRTTVVCPYYINTGMFAGVRTRSRFLFPILEEDRVAERIVRAIRHDRTRVVMPPMVLTIPLLRLFPTWVLDAVADLAGVNTSMDRFRGRGNPNSQPPTPNELPTPK